MAGFMPRKRLLAVGETAVTFFKEVVMLRVSFGRIVLVLATGALAACGQLPLNGAGSQESDWERIVALENEAKAIAKTAGCSTVSECRSAPVGNRACGGPRYYIPYCSLSTDSVALFRKLDEVARAEDAYNRKYQIGSTCEFRMPPPLALSGGECRAAGQ